jgi:hypothetical protein
VVFWVAGELPLRVGHWKTRNRRPQERLLCCGAPCGVEYVHPENLYVHLCSWPIVEIALVGGWRSYHPMLYCGATPLPEEVTIDLLTNWLCFRDVVRLDSAVCAVVMRLWLHQCFSADGAILQFPYFESYHSSYIEWCSSRRIYVGGICLQCNDASNNRQAHLFLQHCGPRLRYCELIGEQNNATLFDISYEVLTRSEDLRGFTMVRSVVSMSTLKRSLCMGLIALRFVDCRFQVYGDPELHGNCANLADLSFAGSTDISEDLIASIVVLCTNLRHLDLCKVSSTTDAIFINVGLHLSQLKGLYALYCRVTDVGVTALAQGCKHLRDLVIGDVYPVCTVTDRSLVELLRNCPDLQVLWLDGLPRITDEVLREVCVRKMKLRRLGIEHMEEVTNELILQVVDCCPGLTDISLPRLVYAQWSTLEYIAVNCKNLRYVEFSGTIEPYPKCPKSLFANEVKVLRR